jgi:hypothetical protein
MTSYQYWQLIELCETLRGLSGENLYAQKGVARWQNRSTS